MNDSSYYCATEPSTSLSLLEGARKGDRESWERIVRLYGPVLYTWARRSRRQPADAADIVQEVFADAAKGLVGFSSAGQNASFRGWLWTITRRRLVDQTRAWSQNPVAMNNESLQLFTDGSTLPLDPPTEVDAERRGILAAALAGLHRRFNAETIEAFRKTVIEGLDPNDVAESLGMSRWSVYKAKSRVLQRLRIELAGLIDPP